MRKPVVLLLLLSLVISTALAVVHAKYTARAYFVESERLALELDELQTQWGRLQLEEGMLGDYSRVEKLARRSLSMRLPPQQSIQMLEVQGAL